MRRFGVWVVVVAFAAALAGCDSGVKEGMPADASKQNPQAGLEDMMKGMGKDMTSQKKGRPPGSK